MAEVYYGKLSAHGEDYCLSVTGSEAEFIEVREENGLIVLCTEKKCAMGKCRITGRLKL